MKNFYLFSLTVLKIGSLILTVTAIISFTLFLYLKAQPSLSKNILFGTTPILQALRGGIVWDGLWPALVGTFYLILGTLIVAFPLGFGCGAYLAIAPSSLTQYFIDRIVSMLSGVPSIVLGLFGFEFLIVIKKLFAPNATTGLWLSILCLSFLVLSPLTSTIKAALKSTPNRTIDACRALGLSKNTILLKIMIPRAKEGLVSAAILTIGRAAEDTAVIMLTGAVLSGRVPRGLLSKFDALPFHIYYKSGQYLNLDDLSMAFAAALILLLLSFSCTLIVKYLGRTKK